MAESLNIKNIKISEKSWKALMLYKVRNDHKSIDEAIKSLLGEKGLLEGYNENFEKVEGIQT